MRQLYTVEGKRLSFMQILLLVAFALFSGSVWLPVTV